MLCEVERKLEIVVESPTIGLTDLRQLRGKLVGLTSTAGSSKNIVVLVCVTRSCYIVFSCSPEESKSVRTKQVVLLPSRRLTVNFNTVQQAITNQQI